MIVVNYHRNNEENEPERLTRKKKKDSKLKNWIEEIKLNRQGKTKHKRSDVMSKYRRVDRILNRLIIILLLLLIITWIVILFY